MPSPPTTDTSDRSPESGDSRTTDTDASSARPTRRRVLAGLGSLATLGSIAGCGGRDTLTDAANRTDTTSTDAPASLGPIPKSAGPWPQARADAGNTGFVAASGPTTGPSLRWSVTSAGTVSANVGRATGTASPEEGLHIAAEDGRIAALDPDGETQWQTALSEARFPPAVGFGRVVVSTGDGLGVLDADTGDRLRSIDLPDNSFDTPTLVDEQAIVSTFSGGVIAVDLESGAQQWQSGDPSRAHPPVVADGTAYVTARRWDVDGDRPGVIAAFDIESGELAWDIGLDSEPTAPPAVRDGVVYAGTNRGRIHAVDAAGGERRWRESVGDWVTRGPTAAADGIYVVVLNEGPVKVGLDGTVEWRSAVGGGTNPVLTDDLAVVGADDGVIAVNRDDGRTRWRAETDAYVQYDVRVADGQIYAGDRYGTVYALDVDSGDPLWRVPFRPTRMPGPVVGPRTVAGGSRDGGTYDLLATEGTELPLSGGAATRGVTPAVLAGSDLPSEDPNATGTATGSTDDGTTRETLVGGGVDGSLFRVRTIEYGEQPSGGLDPTPTPTSTPGPDEPTATATPYIDLPQTDPAWTTTLDAEVRSPVTYADGSAYVGTAKGVVAVDPRDGRERFQVPLDGAVEGAPAVGDGRVFAVTVAGRLVGIATDGDEEGADRIDWEVTSDTGSSAGPAVVNATVFVAGDAGRISMYTAEGDQVWDRSLDSEVAGGTAVTDTHVIVGTEAGAVVALDRDDGSPAWRAAARGAVRGTPAIAGASDPTVYATDHDGTLSAFDASDGSVRFRHRVGQWLDAPPAVGHGAVVVADQTGRVYAVVGE